MALQTGSHTGLMDPRKGDLMTPEQVAILQTVALILDKLGTTPVLVFSLAVLIGPWIVSVWITRSQDKRMGKIHERQDKQFAAAVKMYEDNVVLVKNYEGIASNLQGLVILTTQTMQKLVEKISSNQFCPLVRQQINPDKIEEAGK